MIVQSNKSQSQNIKVSFKKKDLFLCIISISFQISDITKEDAKTLNFNMEQLNENKTIRSI